MRALSHPFGPSRSRLTLSLNLFLSSYLRSQLEQYKSYLQNVRGASGGKDSKGQTPVGVTAVGGKEKKQVKAQLLGPYRFTHAQFEKEGIILESNVPENR